MKLLILNNIKYLFFLIFISVYSQEIISIEEAGRRMTSDGFLNSQVKQINDINNFLNPYVGNWRSIHDNKIYELTLYEERVYTEEIDLYEDRLSFSYRITDQTSGSVLADSSDELLGEAYGIKYQPASGFYEFFMYMDCGESKQVLLGFSPDRMELNGTITVDNHLVFVASNSTFHRPASNGCQSYSHLIPDELILFDRI
jgi:hypothetical protein